MYRFIYCLFVLTLCLFPLFPAQAESDPEVPPSGSAGPNGELRDDNTLLMLSSMLELQNSLKERIREVRVQLEKTSSVAEKAKLTSELQKLDQQLAESRDNFEEVATGVDLGIFSDEQAERFEWKEELISLIKPLIMELKGLTDQARRKGSLKEDMEKFRRMANVAQKGRLQLNALIDEATNEDLKQRLQGLLPEWRSLENQMKNRLEVTRLQLEQIRAEETSFIESSSQVIGDFFRTRGLYLFIAIMVVAAIILAARLGYHSLVRLIPGFKAPHRPFHIRMIDILYRVFTLVLALLGLMLVLYVVEDWVLLSLAILFLIGLAWTLRNAIPKVWDQVRLMLNIGAVREGERIVLYGVPWRVERIHVYSNLKNPDLGEELRLPIVELMDKISRPFDQEEPWFPCRLNDWVILADGTWGKVVSLSHEMVEIVELGGAHTTYQTEDFLAQAPRNISTSFRIKEYFGMSYGQQTGVTNVMLEILEEYISNKLQEEGYDDSLLYLKLEFDRASDSSLDVLVIADFKGSVAPMYEVLRRSIQSWCVDCCTANGWEIPFPQLTVHKPSYRR